LHKSTNARKDYEPLDAKGLSLLIIDDNKVNSRTLKIALEKLGAKVTLAINASEAISLCHDKHSNSLEDLSFFDAIFIGSQIPKQSVSDLLK
jgi:CheY-like chemotaxis protein